MFKAETVAAVILARGGSKGVPGKNLRKVGGLSLVARSVQAARAASRVSAVYVSTDDAAIGAEAAAYGAIIIDRPSSLSGDSASSESGWLHALNSIRRDLPSLESAVFLQCTSPFTRGSDIDGCLALMESMKAACACSVVEDHSFLWTIDNAGHGRGVNHNEAMQRQRRQDLPPTFRESGAIYSVRVADFLQVKRRFCGTVALYVVNHPAVEIDSISDLQLCDMIARSNKSYSFSHELKERLLRSKALVMDFDGVHTDDTVSVDETGKEAVTVSRRDGLGIELLRKSGHLKLLILSKERNPVVLRRAEKLRVECLNACDEKTAALEAWLTQNELQWQDVIYVGNDVNDSGPLKKAGVSACPEDAHPSILPLVDWLIPSPGGKGAVRQLIDLLLDLNAERA